MKSLDLSDIFDTKKEELMQNYKNHYLQQTFRLAWGQVSYHIQDWNTERKLMRELLEKYTLQDFSADLKNWMVSGRMVWGFFGNISTESALQTVENARAQFKLKCTARDQLTPFKVISLPVGEQRIDFEVEDPTNENSCLVTSLQQGIVTGEDVKASKMMDLTC